MGSGALEYRTGYIRSNWPFIRDGGPTVEDDFLGDTFDANLWSSVADAGGTAATIVAASGGSVDLVTSATDDHRTDMAGEIIWDVDAGRGLYIEGRLKASSSICNINFGFSDAKSEATTLLAASATGANVLTTTASNAALWVFDDDLTTNRWLGVGVKADVDATAISGPTTAPTAFVKLGIRISSAGHAEYFLDDVSFGSQSDAVTATTLLVPYLGIQNRSAAARTLTVDYVRVYQYGR